MYMHFSKVLHFLMGDTAPNREMKIPDTFTLCFSQSLNVSSASTHPTELLWGQTHAFCAAAPECEKSNATAANW